jgi:hypothetical protein
VSVGGIGDPGRYPEQETTGTPAVSGRDWQCITVVVDAGSQLVPSGWGAWVQLSAKAAV